MGVMVDIDFDHFDENGLKPIIKEFEKVDLPVSRVEATNKPKRESGFLCKSATLFFESGQKLFMKAKANGSIFQVKLNNKAIPIKHVDDVPKAVKEVVAFVKKNEKRYLKNQRKQLAKKKLKIRKPTPVRTSVKKQTEELTASLEELSADVAELETQKATLDESLTDKRATVEDLRTQLDTETAKTEELQAELDRLKEAA